jgi:hypothetical protein
LIGSLNCYGAIFSGGVGQEWEQTLDWELAHGFYIQLISVPETM